MRRSLVCSILVVILWWLGSAPAAHSQSGPVGSQASNRSR